MFRNDLKIAFRNIRKHRGYAFINISGLAVGLTLCILIALYIQFEFSFDRFHEHYRRICRVEEDWGELGGHIAFSNTPLGPTLKRDYPEIVEYVRLSDMTGSQLLMVDDTKRFYEEGGWWTESSFFRIFSFSLIEGDPSVVLDEPYSIVLSESLADKYFPDQDPIGQVLRLDDTHDCRITGIIEDCPKNSQIQYSFLVSYASYRSFVAEDYFENWWAWPHNYTYVLLSEHASVEAINEKINGILSKHWFEDFEGSVYLNPMPRFHLHSKTEMIGPEGDINRIHIFTAIGVCVLLIVCINDINLATGRSSHRAKEIGVQKVAGATRSRLVCKLLSESVLSTYLGLSMAIILSYLLLPEFNRLVGRNLTWNIPHRWIFLLFLVMIAALVGFFSGIYPALFLSSLKPIRLFTRAFSVHAGRSKWRKTLVFIQFFISVILIVSTLVIRKQTVYLENRSLGYETSDIVVLEYRRTNEESLRNYETLRQELTEHSSIQYAALSRTLPTSPSPFGFPLGTWEGAADQEHKWINTNDVDKHFLNTYGMNLIQGRNFTDDDVEVFWRCILNETAVEQFGWEVDNAVGKRVGQDFIVIGVIKDFHFKSLKEKIGPLVLTPFRPRSNARDRYQLSVKFYPGNIEEALEYIELKFKSFFPSDVFEYRFFDQQLDWMYRKEKRTNRVFSYFTVLTLFIACLGLVGLSSFIGEQRTREIGIRKVFGASIRNILILLSGEFVKPVLLANLFAWPITYFLMDKWLQGFAYRTRMEPGNFLLSGLLSLGIAILTISYQTIRAALADPVESLRYE